MDQSLVHTFSWGNSYGPMVLKVLLKFPPTLALVHGWLFPVEPRKRPEPMTRLRLGEFTPNDGNDLPSLLLRTGIFVGPFVSAAMSPRSPRTI